MIDPAVFVSGGFSNPLEVSKPLNDELVGQDSAEYRQIGTTTSEEENRATRLFKERLELWVVSMEVRKHAKATNLLHGKKLANGK